MKQKANTLKYISKCLKNKKMLNSVSFLSCIRELYLLNKQVRPALTFIFYTPKSNSILNYVLRETSNCFPFDFCLLEASVAEFRPRLWASSFSAPSHVLFHRSSLLSTVWQRWSPSQGWNGSRHAPSAAPATSGSAAASEAEELDSEDVEVLSNVWYWCRGLLRWPLPAPGETKVRKLKCF